MKERWLYVDGAPVYARCWGDSGGSRTVLVHGLGGCAAEWDLVAPGLAETTGGEALAVDLPGFGRSAPGRGGAGLGAQGSVLTTILDARGPALLLGNSMGGLLAVGLAARRPEMVSGLVLVAPALAARVGSAGWRDAARSAITLLPLVGPARVERERRRLGAEQYLDTRLANNLHRPEQLDAEVRDGLLAVARDRALTGEAARAYSDATRSIALALARPRALWRDVDLVRCPTLVVHGEQDRIVPITVAHRLAQRRPDFTVEVMPGCGHLPYLDDPTRFTEVVGEWLRAVAPAPR